MRLLVRGHILTGHLPEEVWLGQDTEAEAVPLQLSEDEVEGWPGVFSALTR